MIFKCKICGGSLDVKQGEKVTECEYCGVKQTIPSFIEPKIQEIYDRANSYLMHNEFDKAENLYNQILFENKEDADAYWNVLMCRYGVTYVKDPASGKYIPTCNRTLYSPIFNDENYQNALKYADEKQKALYIENAQTIDNIQKGILSVSKKEKPFDIFISYKETDINGARTKDSIVAQDLYNKLTAEGYKVFFSRITLEDKIGTEYEPYIYAALASSKVMITVCSSKEHIEAVWVKNEWSRFLSFAGKDSSKTLIPLYFDMDKEELPDDFAHLSAYDMKVNGFEQELIRGIKKLIPLPIMLLERKKKIRKKMKFIGLGAILVAIIAVIVAIPWFEKLPEYNAAMQLYYDKSYPEATWAFDKLGVYRNSEKMKKECELSWRKNLITPADGSEYYITPNGTVDIFPGLNGKRHNEIKINEHGKIMSIHSSIYTPQIYALHEDGYVDNCIENNNLENDNNWQNIVQISPFFNSTNVALRSDGKMVYGDLHNTLNANQNDEWLKCISEWNNIVEFDYSIDMYRYINVAAIVGVRTDGTLCSTIYESNDVNNCSIAIDSLKNLDLFKNVKEIDISFSVCEISRMKTIYYLNVIALSKNNTVMKSINGYFEEYSADNVVDVFLGQSFNYQDNTVIELYLNNDGTVYKNGRNTPILKDVVYINDNIAVTRNGNLYCGIGDFVEGRNEINSSGVKTKVYDEWIERME